ncbi:MAG: Rieske 2Fe-2S domain-containing protein [Pseudomonadota bacterium]
MTRRVELAQRDLPQPGMRALLRIDGFCIALFHTGGALYAIDDSCPHMGSALSGGKLIGRSVQCLAHGLRFDLASGCLAGVPQVRVATYPIHIEAGRVFLQLPAAESC